MAKNEELRSKLLFQPKHGTERLTEEDRRAMQAYCEDYKVFLDRGKTEREAVDYAVSLAEAAGFKPLVPGMALQAGDKVYRSNRGKSLFLAVMGSKGLDEGAHLAAAHVDSPRLDLKPNPLYEDSEMAYLKTHYYGGVRKYQWVSIPLELHGVVALKNGERVQVCLGEKEEDPILVINDLLPHLGQLQSKKPLSEAIPAETLNVLVGSEPLADDEGSDKVKLAVLQLLYERYGFTEEDFLSAELCLVPNYRARDVGLDRSLIGSYGHDDRVCGYAAFRALLDAGEVEKTAVCILADKEEIGSEGVSGMQSAAFDAFLSDLCEGQGASEKRCCEHSFCLSADVTAAYDPNYAEVYEKRNSAQINYGIGLCKYTGHRGKGEASDASAEVVAFVRNLLDEAGVAWQMAELGKTDMGGGGTVAKYMANRNIDTLDAGVPVLAMHSPFEVVSKLDCYMTYKAILALYRKQG